MESSISGILLRQKFIKGAQSVFFWRYCQFPHASKGNIEMVKWIGKFSLLLFLVSTVSEERREKQYLVDVTQVKEERQRRNATALDPNLQEARDHWYAIQVTNHERLFPFSDTLTTLMVIVASELSEAQRERDSQVPFLSRE